MFHFLAGFVCGVGFILAALEIFVWFVNREPKISNAAFEREAERIKEKCVL